MSLTVEPYDEEGIGPDDTIIRRINRDQHVIWDHNRNCYRIASKAYKPSSDLDGGMSVDIEALIIAAEKDPVVYVTTPVFIGSVAFSAAKIRELQLRVGYDPVPQNPYHGEVWGRPERPSRFTGTQVRGLALAARWYVEIEDVELG